MKKTIIIFTLLSCAAKLIAFGRELLLAYYYGTSMISDVYLLSMTLPVTLFGFISTGIISGFIPTYSKIAKKKNNDEAVIFTNRILNILILICLVIIGIYYLLSENTIRILASGFSSEAVELAVKFTNISIWAIIFTCATTVYTGYLQINDRLHVTALVSVPLNLGIIASIIIAQLVNNLMVLPLGYVLACVVQMLYLLLFVKNEKFVYRLSFGFRDGYVKEFYKSIGMLTIGSSIQQINLLIDRTLATGIAVGGLSVFEYGSRINELIIGMSIIPICTVMFPQMAKCAEDTSLLKKRLVDYMMLFIKIVVPITAIVLIFSSSIVKIIYYRGAFDDQSLNMTKKVVFFYAIGLLAFAMRELFSKAFYSLSNVKTPMINSLIGMIINAVLILILSKYMGIGGLALATSISAIITIFMLYFSLIKRIGKIYIKEKLGQILIIITVTAVCSFLSYMIYIKIGQYFNLEIIRLGIAVCCFVVVYFFVLVKLNIFEIDFLKKRKEHKYE